MNTCYARNVTGAVFNLMCSDKYGRNDFLCRRFNISRSTLFRKSEEIKRVVMGSTGRPSETDEQKRIKELELQNKNLERMNQSLAAKVDKLSQKVKSFESGLKKLSFLLIAIGLSGRMVAWLLQSTHGMRISHTTILKEARVYAARSTMIMREYFHQVCVIAAIDELFVEGKPVFLAVDPQSMLIGNAAVHEKLTEENWTEFLNEMRNLTATVSDRGVAILAAVSKREGHTHQSDMFHCKHTILMELLKLENRCYSLITKEENAQVELDKCKRRGKDARKKAALLRRAREKCKAAIELYDNLKQGVDMAFNAICVSDGFTLSDMEEVGETLDFVCQWIQKIHPKWRKVISALQDSNLLAYIKVTYDALNEIDVQVNHIMDKEHVLAVLAYLWEKQAPRRWRGKEVIISEEIRKDLERTCHNFEHVRTGVFKCLDAIPKASSAVECVNSRFGFFRYSKKRFTDDFANLISVVHNMTPFLDGKRKGMSPAQIAGVSLPTMDVFQMFGIN